MLVLCSEGERLHFECLGRFGFLDASAGKHARIAMTFIEVTIIFNHGSARHEQPNLCAIHGSHVYT